MKITTLVDQYLRMKTLQGLAPKHLSTTRKRIEHFLVGVNTVKQVTRDHLLSRLEVLATSPIKGAARSARLPSPKTLNGYMDAIRGFLQYAVEEGLLQANPATAVRKQKAGDPTRIRRALSDDEVQRLLAVSDEAARLCYLLALGMGLRRTEIRKLRGKDFVPQPDGKVLLRIRASTAKNRKAAWLPVPPGVWALLSPFVGEGERRLFGRVVSTRELKAHLMAAMIPFETAEGVVDFHALRVTFCTRLARQNVPLTLAQRLMRHSNPTLTANIYTRFGMGELAHAVEGVDPGLPAG